jgi:hypothetical protein
VHEADIDAELSPDLDGEGDGNGRRRPLVAPGRRQS